MSRAVIHAVNAALLDDVGATGTIAVVFTQPSSYRAIQWTGGDAGPVPLEAGAPIVMAALVEEFAADRGEFNEAAGRRCRAGGGKLHVQLRALLTDLDLVKKR